MIGRFHDTGGYCYPSVRQRHSLLSSLLIFAFAAVKWRWGAASHVLNHPIQRHSKTISAKCIGMGFSTSKGRHFIIIPPGPLRIGDEEFLAGEPRKAERRKRRRRSEAGLDVPTPDRPTFSGNTNPALCKDGFNCTFFGDTPLIEWSDLCQTEASVARPTHSSFIPQMANITSRPNV